MRLPSNAVSVRPLSAAQPQLRPAGDFSGDPPATLTTLITHARVTIPPSESGQKSAEICQGLFRQHNPNCTATPRRPSSMPGSILCRAEKEKANWRGLWIVRVNAAAECGHQLQPLCRGMKAPDRARPQVWPTWRSMTRCVRRLGAKSQVALKARWPREAPSRMCKPKHRAFVRTQIAAMLRSEV